MRNIFKTVFLASVLTLFTASLYSQVAKPIKWQNQLNDLGDGLYEVVFKAEIKSGWHLYGLNIADGGPIATSFNFDQLENFELIGGISSSVKPEVKYDKTFEMDLELFDGEVTFKQKIKKTGKDATVKGYVEFMACDDAQCLPPSEVDFEYEVDETIKAEKKELPQRDEAPVFGANKVTIETKEPVEPDAEVESATETTIENQEASTAPLTEGNEEDKPEKGLLIVFFISLAAGFGALLTPCVYPMIPLTVSFFMRDDKSKGKSIFEAIIFGLSIILIYTALGVLVAIFKDPNAINAVSTHWIPNLLFFVIFIALAVSFFGVFEIMLPNKLANKVDQKADKGGLTGAFFMALGLTILSFSCTGPIVSGLLIKASQGEVLEPVIGMFGFGLAFALPFTLLAIFPGVLNKLPKSGGWLNAVKVFFAFILLAFSLMFLSNIGLSFVTRDLVLALDIVIFALLGFYLLGKLKFSHDSDIAYVSVPRLVLAIISFAIAIYLVPGLFGSPLKVAAPFLPAQETTEFNLSAVTSSTGTQNASSEQKLCHEQPKHSDLKGVHLPHGLKGYFDYEEGLACAKEQNKPVFIDFVGHTCKNCKKMYADVWSDPEVLQILREEYIVIALYTDERTELPENEWVVSEIDGKTKKTIGKRNVDFQITKFNSNAQPLYSVLDANGEIVSSPATYAYNPDIEDFKSFLKEGVKNFNK